MRLVFVVEGDTEIILVEKLLMPYLLRRGINVPMNCVTILTNRKQNKKGGVTSYGLFRNTLERTLAQPNVVVTTLIDFFKLPTEFPGYTEDSNLITQIEGAILEDMGNPENLIPYIQKHELEAIMFSSMDGFEIVVDEEEKLRELEDIIQRYPNPEDINNSPETAPSKRLAAIFDYQKVLEGELILDALGIERMLAKCPRFRLWVEGLVERFQ